MSRKGVGGGYEPRASLESEVVGGGEGGSFCINCGWVKWGGGGGDFLTVERLLGPFLVGWKVERG